MSQQTLNRPLRGIIPPMVTPLKAPDTLDEAGLERLVEHMVVGGVHGLFILGTTGEGPALSYRIRRELIHSTCKLVRGRVPVLVGVTDTSFEETCLLAETAISAGADAIVAAPPYYFAMSQDDLLRYVRGLSQRVALPLYLYNMPSLIKTRFEPETIMRAAELPNVYGLKDSSGDLAYVSRIVACMGEDEDFTVLVGPEELLAKSLRMGVHGGVNGGANLFPRLFVKLYEAALTNDAEEVDHLQQQVVRLGKLLYGIGEPESSYLRGLKLGLSVLGICSARLTMPYLAADPASHSGLLAAFEKHGLI